uniref:Menaquinone biosynthesis protein n=1 Tax=Sciadococcus taiwanensis TaxID=3028030 RepID=A0A9Y1I202_9RHOD|nr:menaquinone biosynthesis protein [Sciadococcus taiwanensis]
MSNLESLLIGARPKTLLISLAPFILGTSLAYNVNRYVNIALAMFTLLLFVVLQIFANYSNDYLDYINGKDTLKRRGPLRITQSGLLSIKSIQNFLILLLWLVVFLACIVGHLSHQNELFILFFIIFSLAFGWLYTGGPLHLGYRGFGELMVFLSFGPLGVFTSYYLQLANLLPNFEVLISSISCGLIASSVLVVNNLRDKASDKYTKKNTLCVLLGKSFCQIEYVSILLGGCLISFILLIKNQSNFILLYFLICLFVNALRLSRFIFLVKTSTQYNWLLAKTSQFLLLYSCLISLSLIIK